MAQVAQGIECPACATFTTCSGKFSDTVLDGQCPCCSRHVTMGNASFVAGGMVELEALRSENAALKAQLNPEPESEVTPSPAVDPEPEPEPVPVQASDDDLLYEGPVGAKEDVGDASE